uniref:F-box domain-containing protein n=1 Tax=Meloidogyne enterolobii TaxID=390850 RepID=A0A6V7VDJ7_MELEN|nr:unnamed protein product [Meloidogyne enterolobii]
MNLPLETTLDVLKFLNFNQISSLKLTNSIFLCLINRFEKVLPQMVFKELSLVHFSYKTNNYFYIIRFPSVVMS